MLLLWKEWSILARGGTLSWAHELRRNGAMVPWCRPAPCSCTRAAAPSVIERTAQAVDVSVSVLAPPPAVTWLANDKAHLSEAVALCVDPDALLDTHETRGIEELFDTVRAFRGRYPSVGIKRTRCASAMGNLVLHEEETGGWSDETLRARLEAEGLLAAAPAQEVRRRRGHLDLVLLRDQLERLERLQQVTARERAAP